MASALLENLAVLLLIETGIVFHLELYKNKFRCKSDEA